MITLLTGDNSFEIERAIKALVDDFKGLPERINAETVQLSELPDLLMGVSLFADKRLLIIRDLSGNRTIWPVIGDWLSKVSDDIHLVLVESKLDKRTATYKALKQAADIKEFAVWSERDRRTAEQWAIAEAKRQGVTLTKKIAELLVQRVGVDHWQLFHAIEKLALLDEISEEVVDDIVDASLSENVFNLFEVALSGKVEKLTDMLRILEHTEDIYRLTALLFSQAFQLAAIISAGPDNDVARDLAVHPFVVSKLQSIAHRIGKTGVSRIINILVDLDDEMKTSSAESWLLVETALLKIASLQSKKLS